MTTIDFEGHDLVVRLHGIDRLYAWRSVVRVPLMHVTDARVLPAGEDFDHVVGGGEPTITYSFGKVIVGSIDTPNGRTFFDVRDPGRAVTIDLEGEQHEHLVVEVAGETPERAVARILEARGRSSAGVLAPVGELPK